MEEIYKEIFNASGIYDMLFINVTGVLEYDTLQEMTLSNPEMAKTWIKIAGDSTEETYRSLAVDFPEFNKIVAISYGQFYFENGLQRNFKRIVNENEYVVLATFFSDLIGLSENKIICGDNVLNYDIPMLIKRFLANRPNFQENENKLPNLLKNFLKSKPWDSTVIDTRLIWKFNGLNAAPKNTQELYSNFLGLKKTVELMKPAEISSYYWRSDNSEKLNVIGLQSATKVNLSMQLMNFLREI